MLIDHATQPGSGSFHSFVTVRARARGLHSSRAVSLTYPPIPMMNFMFLSRAQMLCKKWRVLYKRFRWARVENKKRRFCFVVFLKFQKEKGKTSTTRFLHVGVGWKSVQRRCCFSTSFHQEKAECSLTRCSTLSAAPDWLFKEHYVHVTTLQPIRELLLKRRPSRPNCWEIK